MPSVYAGLVGRRKAPCIPCAAAARAYPSRRQQTGQAAEEAQYVATNLPDFVKVVQTAPGAAKQYLIDTTADTTGISAGDIAKITTDIVNGDWNALGMDTFMAVAAAAGPPGWLIAGLAQGIMWLEMTPPPQPSTIPGCGSVFNLQDNPQGMNFNWAWIDSQQISCPPMLCSCRFTEMTPAGQYTNLIWDGSYDWMTGCNDSCFQCLNPLEGQGRFLDVLQQSVMIQWNKFCETPAFCNAIKQAGISGNIGYPDYPQSIPQIMALLCSVVGSPLPAFIAAWNKTHLGPVVKWVMTVGDGFNYDNSASAPLAALTGLSQNLNLPAGSTLTVMVNAGPALSDFTSPDPNSSYYGAYQAYGDAQTYTARCVTKQSSAAETNVIPAGVSLIPAGTADTTPGPVSSAAVAAAAAASSGVSVSALLARAQAVQAAQQAAARAVQQAPRQVQPPLLSTLPRGPTLTLPATHGWAGITGISTLTAASGALAVGQPWVAFGAVALGAVFGYVESIQAMGQPAAPIVVPVQDPGWGGAIGFGSLVGIGGAMALGMPLVALGVLAAGAVAGYAQAIRDL